MKVFLLDDEPAALATLRSFLLRAIPLAEIREANSIQGALDVLDEYRPDLALLDINLGSGTSFDLLGMLDEDRLSFKIIFISGHDEYAVKAFKYNALDYILKPINPFEFKIAIEKVTRDLIQLPDVQQIRQLTQSVQDNDHLFKKIVLKDQNTIQIVEVNDIVYCMSDNNYTEFHLKDGQVLVISQTLKEYELLLRERGFFRVHRSYLINMNQLRKFDKREGGSIEMSDGSHIPLARAKKETFLEVLQQF
ncbi:LytTR family DNA-binding domain-containing protein [Reichenbachiella agarivorans]|uniref:LytTR family DNA-binding domain-containing protein n=1 Tax=Reichenbachiella agarivorans TaxID=2979464 RepID=A0ABY6CTD5_9BACT|nr:LytTR family DNA-binding domain-containing protein [Reichenbachiella agarivorans]UXP32723.1 LytTR family DNA-binding domain-containing protein [Reichenbachiella agarivorans]